MSHYFAVVLAPDLETVDAAVEAAMEPYREDSDGDGRWDWWVIGGRWTGVWAEYDPAKDPSNLEDCYLCGGTGLRNDAQGRAYREEHPDYTCNGCVMAGAPPGRKLKFAADWARHPGDIVPVPLLLQTLQHRQSPYAFVSPTGWIERESWNGDDFVKNPNFDADYRAALEAHRSMLAVVVDYHS